MSLVSMVAAVLACVVLAVNASTATAVLSIPIYAIAMKIEDDRKGICSTVITAGHAVVLPT